MAIFNYPHSIDKNTPATAVEVQENFNALLTWVMDNVMLKDGSLPATGPIVLPPGPPASPDHAANKAYVDAVVPIGTIWEFGGTTLPAGWLWCDGQTYSTGSQQPLYNAIQRAFTGTLIPQGSFQVPNKQGKFAVGAHPSDAAFRLGKSDGGQRDAELPTHHHTVLAHTHSIQGNTGNDLGNHEHSLSGVTVVGEGAHTHTGTGYNDGSNGGVGFRGGVWSGAGGYDFGFNQPSPVKTGWYHSPPVAADGSAHQHNLTGSTTGVTSNHVHGPGTLAIVTHPDAFTSDVGLGSTLLDKNLPPYVVVNYIIYAGKP